MSNGSKTWDLRASAVPSPAFDRRPGRRAAARSYRPALIAAVLLAAVAAFAIGHDPAAHGAASADAELARLLRFMAVLKAAMALAALWLVDWRLRFAASPRLAMAYIAALALMAAGPGLIWSLTHLIAGAILFHAGLLLLLALGWADGTGPVPAIGRLLPAARRRP